MGLDLKELANSVIKKGAPLLGSVIRGPAGAVVGKLVAPDFGASEDEPIE